MRQTIRTQAGKEITLECNASTPVIFKRIFHKNLINEFTQIDNKEEDEKIELIQQMFYIMAESAEKPIRELLMLTEINYIEFLTGFGMTELLDEKILKVVTELWSSNIEVNSEPKNPS